ncbi:DNA-binding response regulator [Deltaproteobacteria bacterium Smac51]|nr:DNA-binding response regulator [Deltaproteobacteria bacterium Smac51]
METILIVDDEKNYHLTLTALFQHEGYETISAYSGNEAWAMFQEQDVDLVLSDMTMPDGDGLELLARIKGHKPEVPVVMLTAFGTVELAVEAMKRGAFDYLTKPCPNDEMLRAVAKALEVSRLGRQNKELLSALSERYSFGSLIGKSKPMLELYKVLEKVAPTKANVLITGESGTGKELVAQALHYNSLRPEGPFVAVNCSALSATLLESELFGHEKGAFTDARQNRAGRFELADGGSLFLDEIGETDQSLQVKLLRVIQERRFERVGGSRSIPMDVRLIAATNRDLKKEVAEGNFREDLFYRLNVVHLLLPPLRERMDDLPLLIDHFLRKFGEGEPAPKGMNREAMRMMFSYSWPGNIRELQNVIERGVVLSSGAEIMPEDLPEDIRRPAEPLDCPPEIMAALDTAFMTHAQPITITVSESSDTLITPPRQVTAPRSESIQAAVPSRSETLMAEGAGSWLKEAQSILPDGFTLDGAISALEEGMIRSALSEHGAVQSHAATALGLKKNVFKYKWDKYVDKEPTILSSRLSSVVPKGMSLVEALESLEEAMLRAALERTGGVQSQAADILGIKKNLMQYKLKKFSINPKE